MQKKVLGAIDLFQNDAKFKKQHCFQLQSKTHLNEEIPWKLSLTRKTFRIALTFEKEGWAN